jgi:putative endonuclease
MWFLYMIRCSDGSLYTGITTDIERRLREHNGGGGRASRYVRARLPAELVYSEKLPDRGSAAAREAAVKKMSKQDKLALVRAACPG